MILQYIPLLKEKQIIKIQKSSIRETLGPNDTFKHCTNL